MWSKKFKIINSLTAISQNVHFPLFEIIAPLSFPIMLCSTTNCPTFSGAWSFVCYSHLLPSLLIFSRKASPCLLRAGRFSVSCTALHLPCPWLVISLSCVSQTTSVLVFSPLSPTFVHFIHFHPFYPLSPTFILFHPLSSTFIHCHPLSSTFIHFHPLSSTFIHFIHFHPRSSTFIHFHPLSSTFINFHPLSSTFINFHQLSSTFIHLVCEEHRSSVLII